MANSNRSESKRIKPKQERMPPKDRSMHGGIRGGDPAARKPKDENLEPPIIQRSAS